MVEGFSYVSIFFNRIDAGSKYSFLDHILKSSSKPFEIVFMGDVHLVDLGRKIPGGSDTGKIKCIALPHHTCITIHGILSDDTPMVFFFGDVSAELTKGGTNKTSKNE